MDGLGISFSSIKAKTPFLSKTRRFVFSFEIFCFETKKKKNKRSIQLFLSTRSLSFSLTFSCRDSAFTSALSCTLRSLTVGYQLDCYTSAMLYWLKCLE
uniref:Uncharacterized protein n=1 Tax=Salix viminalis TaxID=40686 RepID=A0A6N2M9K7_SALVM